MKKERQHIRGWRGDSGVGCRLGGGLSGALPGQVARRPAVVSLTLLTCAANRNVAGLSAPAAETCRYITGCTRRTGFTGGADTHD